MRPGLASGSSTATALSSFEPHSNIDSDGIQVTGNNVLIQRNAVSGTQGIGIRHTGDSGNLFSNSIFFSGSSGMEITGNNTPSPPICSTTSADRDSRRG